MAALLAAQLGGSTARAQDLQSKLDHKQAALQHQHHKAGVLTTTIQHYTDQISQLSGQVATLRNRVAVVGAALSRKQAELQADQRRLVALKAQLGRSLKVLSSRLVAIYESDQPDALTVMLNSHGFDDLLTRYDYIRRIQQNDSDVATRVRDLRDQTRATVKRVTAERDAIASRKAELERTQAALQIRQSTLATARTHQQNVLDAVRSRAADLDKDIKSIQGQIAAQLQAAQASPATPAFPIGPVPGQSAAGLIWPVNGPITSPFGPRWGSFHPGLDIGVPMGTPIRAAASGAIVFAKPYGGYGNYTCIDHGGGLSTCYAHQSAFAVTSGAVKQGEVIGYVGSTGFSTGPHLHFEVRINGQPVDPLGYLS